MVKHKATELGGTGTVKSRATDLGAARDDEVTVAGGPNTDEQLRIQAQSQTDRHQNRGTHRRREDHRAKAEADHAEDDRRRARDIGEVVNEDVLVRIKEGTRQPRDTEDTDHAD